MVRCGGARGSVVITIITLCFLMVMTLHRPVKVHSSRHQTHHNKHHITNRDTHHNTHHLTNRDTHHNTHYLTNRDTHHNSHHLTNRDTRHTHHNSSHAHTNLLLDTYPTSYHDSRLLTHRNTHHIPHQDTHQTLSNTHQNIPHTNHQVTLNKIGEEDLFTLPIVGMVFLNPLQLNCSTLMAHSILSRQLNIPLEEYNIPLNQHRTHTGQQSIPFKQHKTLAKQLRIHTKQHGILTEQNSRTTERLSTPTEQPSRPTEQYSRPTEQLSTATNQFNTATDQHSTATEEPNSLQPNNNTMEGQTTQVESQLVTPPIETKQLHKCSVTVRLSPCGCVRVVESTIGSPCPQGGVLVEDTLRHITNHLGESTCSHLASLRGAQQKVVSLSVFGPFPSDYHAGVAKLIPRISQVYPDWTVRVYLDTSGPATNTTILTWMCRLACRYPNLDFCDVSQLPNLSSVWRGRGEGWRLGVVGESLVSNYMVRDVDSPILNREVQAVRQWMQRGTCYHVMRDHPFHGVEMLAGLWGGCNNWSGAKDDTVAHQALCTNQQDQALLKAEVWPVAQLNGTIHDSYTCGRFPGSLPFPSQRVNFTFVGQRTLRARYRWERTHTVCPITCRPKLHQDWIYC